MKNKDFESTQGHNKREEERKRETKETFENPRNPKHEKETDYEKEGFGKRSQVSSTRSKIAENQGKQQGEQEYDKEYQNRSNKESQAKSKKTPSKSKQSGRLSNQGAQGDPEHQQDGTFPAENYEKQKNFK